MMHESRRSVDKRRSTAFVPKPPEPVFCTENERCRGCPYPAHGIVCWHRGGGCLRTDTVCGINREETRLRVRLLHDGAPVPGAVAVRPTLEDAYLHFFEGEQAI